MQPAISDQARLLGAQLRLLRTHYEEDGRLAVANAFLQCVNDQEALAQAEQYRDEVIKWVRAGLGDGDLVEMLKSYASPPSDPLLTTLRLLIRNLDEANKRSGKKIEEEKSLAKVAQAGADPNVASGIFVAATELQKFLVTNDSHFGVVVEGKSLGGYLGTVLTSDDFSCNNAVAMAMSNALRDQFNRLPPCVEVGRRLLQAGFFDNGTEAAQEDPSDFLRLTAKGEDLTAAVEQFKTGKWTPDTVDKFQSAYAEAGELLGIYVTGPGIKKKMLDLNALVESHILNRGDGGLVESVKKKATEIKFL